MLKNNCHQSQRTADTQIQAEKVSFLAGSLFFSLFLVNFQLEKHLSLGSFGECVVVLTQLYIQGLPLGAS